MRRGTSPLAPTPRAIADDRRVPLPEFQAADIGAVNAHPVGYPRAPKSASGYENGSSAAAVFMAGGAGLRLRSSSPIWDRPSISQGAPRGRQHALTLGLFFRLGDELQRIAFAAAEIHGAGCLGFRHVARIDRDDADPALMASGPAQPFAWRSFCKWASSRLRAHIQRLWPAVACMLLSPGASGMSAEAVRCRSCRTSDHAQRSPAPARSRPDAARLRRRRVSSG